MRLDVISVALISITALMMVLMHGQIPPAYAGLAISYAVQVASSLWRLSYPVLLQRQGDHIKSSLGTGQDCAGAGLVDCLGCLLAIVPNNVTMFVPF